MKALDQNSPKNQGLRYKSNDCFDRQSGSVIVWIFVAIALLAALVFAMTNGSRTGTQNLSSQQADLAATEILNYANAVKNAVRQLQINGCGDTEISFENNIVAGYTNPNAPSDNSCDVFHLNGGGLQYSPPSNNNLDTTLSSFTAQYYGEWPFSGDHCIGNLGTCPTNNHLMMFLSQIPQSVCAAINDRNNIGAGTIPAENWDITNPAANFIGTYNLSTNRELTHSDIDGRLSACIQDNTGTTSGQYIFYQVLLAR